MVVPSPRDSGFSPRLPTAEAVGFLMSSRGAGLVRGVCAGWRPKEGTRTLGYQALCMALEDVAPQFPPLTMWDSVRWGTGHKPSASGAEDDSPPF
jgi:hypothetical protein